LSGRMEQMDEKIGKVDSESSPRQEIAEKKVCGRCGGTGLICGNVPRIDSKNCCVDFLNAVCPECRGTGAVRR
jgi:hypothetical protein